MTFSCTEMVISSVIWQNVFLALFIMLLVVAVAYMLGNLVRREEYIEFAKHELYNVFVTLAIVFSFSAIVYIANEISCSTANGANLFEQAVTGMNTLMYSDVYPLLRTLFMIMLEISALSNMTVVISSIKFNPFAGLKYFHTSLNVVSFILESVFASLYIQLLSLIVLKETAFSILMPVGIFLRTFPITRDAGTFLMALSFSFYTLYPFIYAVSLGKMNGMEKLYNNVEFSNSGWNDVWSVFQRVEDTLFYALTAFSYSSVREMFLSIGRYLFITIAIPALAIILSVAMAHSILKFINEVSA